MPVGDACDDAALAHLVGNFPCRPLAHGATRAFGCRTGKFHQLAHLLGRNPRWCPGTGGIQQPLRDGQIVEGGGLHGVPAAAPEPRRRYRHAYGPGDLGMVVAVGRRQHNARPERDLLGRAGTPLQVRERCTLRIRQDDGFGGRATHRRLHVRCSTAAVAARDLSIPYSDLRRSVLEERNLSIQRRLGGANS